MHIVPKALCGKDEKKNIQVLHRHCHDEKTVIDLKEIRKKDNPKHLKKLDQQWEGIKWEWENDIPKIYAQEGQKSQDVNGNHVE